MRQGTRDALWLGGGMANTRGRAGGGGGRRRMLRSVCAQVGCARRHQSRGLLQPPPWWDGRQGMPCTRPKPGHTRGPPGALPPSQAADFHGRKRAGGLSRRAAVNARRRAPGPLTGDRARTVAAAHHGPPVAWGRAQGGAGGARILGEAAPGQIFSLCLPRARPAPPGPSPAFSDPSLCSSFVPGLIARCCHPPTRRASVPGLAARVRARGPGGAPPAAADARQGPSLAIQGVGGGRRPRGADLFGPRPRARPQRRPPAVLGGRLPWQ